MPLLQLLESLPLFDLQWFLETRSFTHGGAQRPRLATVTRIASSSETKERLRFSWLAAADQKRDFLDVDQTA